MSIEVVSVPAVTGFEKPTPDLPIVGGGTRGFAKTCLAANLAVEGARGGWRGILVDAARVCGELVARAESMRPRIVVNRASNGYETQAAANILSKLIRRRLLVEPQTLGFLYFDSCVADALHCGVPFVVGYPRWLVFSYVADVANRLGFF